MRKVLWEAPTYRNPYQNLLESLDYPLQFCGNRFCKNEKCPERPDYRKFVNHTCSLKKSQQLDGKNKSF